MSTVAQISAPPDLSSIVDRLCAISEKACVAPHEAIEWPASVGPDEWCMSPELVSLHGTPAFAAMSEPLQKRLAFFETVNFFSLNINGEKSLIEGLARRLYPPRGKSVTGVDLSPYIHHFLDEENKHMFYFGTFCRKYAGKTYPEKKLAVAREEAPGEADLLFFLKVMIFEEIVDVYNVRMSRDERLAPVARRINLLHHQDETRHLVFGRLLVKTLWETLSPSWSVEQREGIGNYARSYFEATWKEYYNPEVYRDAGIADSYSVYKEALAHAETRAHRARVSAKCVKYLREIGILSEEPSL